MLTLYCNVSFFSGVKRLHIFLAHCCFPWSTQIHMRRTRSSSRSVRRTRSHLPTRKGGGGKRRCRLTTRGPSKRSRRAIKKSPSRAKRGGAEDVAKGADDDAKERVVVNAQNLETSVLNDAQNINVSISTNTSASGTYTRVDKCRDKPVWSFKVNDENTAYVYYDTSDKLTIGIFKNSDISSGLPSFLNSLGWEPCEWASDHWRLTSTGWNTGILVSVGFSDTEFIWDSTKENIEITIS